MIHVTEDRTQLRDSALSSGEWEVRNRGADAVAIGTDPELTFATGVVIAPNASALVGVVSGQRVFAICDAGDSTDVVIAPAFAPGSVVLGSHDAAGTVRLSTAPADPGLPIAVGDNDPRLGIVSSLPTDILVIGSVDVPLLNGWTDDSGEGEPLPRIYKQAGRAWLMGVLVAPDPFSPGSAAFHVPSGYEPFDPSDIVMVAAAGSWNAACVVEISGSNVTIGQFSGVSALDFAGSRVFLDGISWPLVV